MVGYTIEFILKGDGSDITIFLPTPIVIPDGKRASLGLKNFSTYNNIANVEKGKNNAFMLKVPGKPFRLFELPTGAFELDSICEAIYEFIEEHYPSIKDVREKFKLAGSDATSKCILTFKDDYGIDFNVPNSLCEILGYEKTDKFQGPGRFIAEKIVMIATVTQLLFNCNIVEGSYFNSLQIPLIYNCVIDVPAGYRLSRELTNISYKRLNTSQISNIHLWITDEQGRFINLRKDLLVVTLSLIIEND